MPFARLKAVSLPMPIFIKSDACNRLNKAKVKHFRIVSLVKTGPTEFVLLLLDSRESILCRREGKIFGRRKFVLTANAIKQNELT